MIWPIEYLESITKRGSGHTPSQRHPEYWNGGIKWVSLADSSELDKYYIYETLKQISPLGLQHSSAVLHPKGTVIVSRDAGVGKSAILGDEMAVSQHFIAWQCDGKQLCEEYLYQWLQSEKSEFERVAVGSTIKTIGLSYFQKLRLPLPPLAVQKKIARVLETWDIAIQKTARLITEKEMHKKGVMQRVFKTPKLPHKKLANFTHRITRKNTLGNGHPLTISGENGLISQSKYFGKRIAAESTEHYTLLKRGEYAYNRSYSAGSPLGAIKRLNTYNEGIVSTLYLCFALNDKESPLSDYFSYFCEAGGFNHQIYKIAQEGARNHGLLNVTAEDFFSMSMPVPSSAEQAQTVAILNAADKELTLLRAQLSALRTQKRGLMRKLLTGQWRLPLPAHPTETN